MQTSQLNSSHRLQVLPSEGSVSACNAEWTREHKHWLAWNPGRSLLVSIRGYQRSDGRNAPYHAVLRCGYVLRHHFWSAVSGADIPLNSKIGGWPLIPHRNGIVIHPASDIGPNCLILQQVTIESGQGGVPTLWGHGHVGAGTKILGAVHIGHYAVIGANASVVEDVIASTTVVGIPARLVSGESQR